MKAALAIYDMDRTITRRPTYAAFMWRAVTRLAPWRVVLAPLVILTTLAYLAGLIDRGRLKEMNFRLLVGRVAPERLERVVQGFADRQVTTNIMAGARARLAEDKAAGRRLVLATASYRLYAAAIAQRLGFDDVIATDVEYDRAGPHRRPDRRRQLLRPRQARHDRGLAAAAGAGARGGPHPLLFRPRLRRPRPPLVRRSLRHQRPCPAGPLAEDEGWEVLDWRDRQAGLHRVMTAASDTFVAFVDVLADALDDHEATGEDLAARLYLSRYHFDRLIASVAGEPPPAFRRRILLERAAYRSLTTGRTVLDIAVEAGYCSNEAFTRAFTRAYGVRPAAWREQPTQIQIEAPSDVHFHPPGGLRLPGASEGDPDGPDRRRWSSTTSGWSARWSTAPARLDDAVLDRPIEISVEGVDDDPTLR